MFMQCPICRGGRGVGPLLLFLTPLLLALGRPPGGLARPFRINCPQTSSPSSSLLVLSGLTFIFLNFYQYLNFALLLSPKPLVYCLLFTSVSFQKFHGLDSLVDSSYVSRILVSFCQQLS